MQLHDVAVFVVIIPYFQSKFTIWYAYVHKFMFIFIYRYNCKDDALDRYKIDKENQGR